MSQCTCEICEEPILEDELHSNGEQNFHLDCFKKWQEDEAVSHGIPRSVVEGKTSLADHFSIDYINWKCGKVSDD